MVGVKRKSAPSVTANGMKKQKTAEATLPRRAKEDLAEGDEFGGFSDADDESGLQVTQDGIQQNVKTGGGKSQPRQPGVNGLPKQFKLETSSAETHAKQRALAKERKASKPSADAIQRSKKIWERLRRKSHVPPEERKQLVAELFDIISGRVRDFVFKHDSVRVIQCALKYANQEQRRNIMQELKGDVRELAESRYGKFLVAKMVSSGDAQVRDAVIPEFYGHVRRLINHPEASWIVDDIYRQAATSQQKATMLQEWYGAEFALFHRKPGGKVPAVATHEDTVELVKILEKSPEKRKPILQYLLQMINSQIQKKTTGFTMLHDAMLQYFLALNPGSEEHAEFLEILKGDIDKETEGGGGDLYRNLAFTKSGSRLVCLALAYGSAKDRKTILRVFKDTIELMAFDQYAKMVLVTGLDVPDDTKMSYRSILFELFGQSIEDESQQLDRLETLVTDLNARLVVLYPVAGMAKWLVGEQEKAIIAEVHKIRETTSKKAPEVRRKELLDQVSATLLELVAKRSENLVRSSFGCQFITEALLEAKGEKRDAKRAVAILAAGDPAAEGHVANHAAARRMLKTLVLGGQFDPKTKSVKPVEPRLEFGDELFAVIEDYILEWACGESNFVVVGFLESENVSDNVKVKIKTQLQKHKMRIEAAANEEGKEDKKGNAGVRIILEKI